jgi:hypothetical protein
MQDVASNLARGGAVERLEGNTPVNRLVIVEVPDIVRLKAFYNSVEYQPLLAIRQRAARSNARHRRRVSASPLRRSLAPPTVRGRSCRRLATQADGRDLSARVRRSCQVCVRAVYLLRAGATGCRVLNEPFAHADYFKTDSKDARRQS